MEHHHHHHHGKQSFHEANKDYFSSNIANFEKPENLGLARRAAKAMREQYPFDEDSTVVMDFACGVGLISMELAPYAKSIVGVDITQALVDNYNQRVEHQGVSPDEMRAVCSHLKGEEGELDGLKFDVIVCSASYHHFESIEDITRMLSFFLKPGGVLLVVDIQDPTEAHTHPTASSSTQTHTANGNDHVIPQKYHHMVPHTRGFKSATIRKVFEEAGLTSFSFNIAMKAEKSSSCSFDEKITFFIAKGEKPSI